MREMSELGIDELLDLLATLIPELPNSLTADFNHGFALARDLLSHVTTPGRPPI
jgi:hypothetical protein